MWSVTSPALTVRKASGPVQDPCRSHTEGALSIPSSEEKEIPFAWRELDEESLIAGVAFARFSKSISRWSERGLASSMEVMTYTRGR